MPAFGDNNIGVALRRLDEHLMHGLDRGQILRDDRLQIAAAVAHVAHDAPQDAHIGVRVHKELDVQPIAQLGLGKDEDALDDDDLGRHDCDRLGCAVVHRVVICRALDGLPGAQRVEVLHEQRRVERVRVVVVELFALGEGNVVMPLIIVVAETFLDTPVLVNNVRGVQGYTGTWKGVPVTVMASGMGIPSIGIYSWELYNFYDVDNIIRVGSAGALADDLNLMDVVAGAGACTDSNFAHQFGLNGTFAPIADYTLLSQAVAAAAANGVTLHVGNVLSADNFYDDGSDGPDQWKKMGVLAVEMEAAGLYMNAARAGKRALGLFTISDHIYRAEELTSEQRQNSFVQMITIALDTAANMANL